MLPTSEFFERFEKDRGELQRKMGSVWLAEKLFAHRNDGNDPTMVVDLKRHYERRLTLVHQKQLKKEK